MNKHIGDWFHRRLMIYALLTFCMTLLVWLAWYGTNGDLHLMIAEGCFWLIGAILFFYIVGATVQDVQFLKHLPGPVGAAVNAMSEKDARDTVK